MTRTHMVYGSYVDATPDGAYAVLFPGSHIQTHLGHITLPPNDQPLYHRITTVGGFKIAGQAHQSNRTLEWIGGEWTDGPAACGVSPVIYDHKGVLWISQCGPVGSQGFRYVNADGELVTGDQTYGSSFGLSEWSAYGGLSIGQGHSLGGCLVWDGAVLRQLEPGDCRFIRVQGDGERVAISFVKPDGAVIVQTTLAELRALPVVSAPAPAPIPVPVPVPPAPSPEPSPMEMPLAAWRIIHAMHARFASTLPATEDGARTFTEMTLEQLKFSDPDGGWVGKRASPTRPKSKDVAARLIAARFEGWDILSGAGVSGPRVLATYPPAYHDLIAEGNQVPFEVRSFNHLGIAPPPVEPPPVDPPPAPGRLTLTQRVTELERVIARLKAAL